MWIAATGVAVVWRCLALVAQIVGNVRDASGVVQIEGRVLDGFFTL